MTDRQTIETYNQQAGAYADLTRQDKPDPQLVDFVACLPDGGHVLDLGCGPANASAYMRQEGLQVDPVDASSEMVRLANDTHDIGARQATFDDIDVIDIYDGIWANFSLLHASTADLPRHLAAVHRALKPSGYFHIGMKLGSGEKRDKLGRQYSYYSRQELKQFLTEAGFTVLAVSTGEGVGLSGEMAPWVTMISRAG